MEERWDHINGQSTKVRARAQDLHRMLQQRLEVLSQERWNRNSIIQQQDWWSITVVSKVVCAHPRGCARWSMWYTEKIMKFPFLLVFYQKIRNIWCLSIFYKQIYKHSSLCMWLRSIYNIYIDILNI